MHAPLATTNLLQIGRNQPLTTTKVAIFVIGYS